MQVVALTGASGFIGSHLLENLSKCSNLSIRLLVNRSLKATLKESKNISIVQGNLLDSKTLNGFVETGCIVINLAYLHGVSHDVNIAAVNNLLEACYKTKIKRLIHCSTAVLSGEAATERVTENTTCKPLQEYGITKRRIEKIILEKSNGVFETVILRPTAVFGKGGQNLVQLIDSLINGNRFVNYLKSCIYQHRRMHLVYIDNVVAAIRFLMQKERDINGEIFIISDDDDPSNNYRDIERYLMARIGCKEYPITPISMPFTILKLLLRMTGKINDNPNLVYDCSKILTAGFQKPLSFNEGLLRFSDWYTSEHYSDRHHQ